MKNAETVTFGGSSLNRAAHLRGRDDQTRLSQHENAQVVLCWRAKPLLMGSGTGPLSLVRQSFADVEKNFPVQALAFLGLEENGNPLFSADVSGWEPEDIPDNLDAFLDASEQRHSNLPEDHRFAELRASMTRLSARDAELAVMARGLFEWHRIHGYCAMCGDKSHIAQGGWQRDCPSCGRSHFPRTDPVVIMLITKGNSVLIGRSPGWPDGMYSLLAGFMEPGETMEAAVRREVLEETNIEVGEVSYLASQPWPFPASLMMGCHGEALTDQITIDPKEIDDAVWVTREEMSEVFEGVHPFIKPAREGAIAHFLLQRWLSDTLD